jgi:hypothetical protein
MIVEMTKDEVLFYACMAPHRWVAKFKSTDRPNYKDGKDSKLLEHELTATVRTMLAEWAVAKSGNYTINVPWYPNELHLERQRLPDCGSNIEVRTSRTRDSIAVWEKDVDKFIYGVKCLDEVEFSKFDVIGYISYEEVTKHPEWRDSRFGGWGVPLHALTKV